MDYSVYVFTIGLKNVLKRLSFAQHQVHFINYLTQPGLNTMTRVCQPVSTNPDSHCTLIGELGLKTVPRY